ncbi:hypothetical protein CYMTET_29741 [Cymbomonas tetramitiformis]|uniref:Uncharacterized protein n=1 Tax=Cymbomonas tetramitiformis TaxID=36881 RepID=A0AAE0KUV0_9CHLO|nr:hypothetical protein CYMTET_29741 [Cymbomonas tetramitiformis]
MHHTIGTANDNEWPMGFRPMGRATVDADGYLVRSFGLMGLGQMVGMCHPSKNMSLAILFNQLGSDAAPTMELVKFICDELGFDVDEVMDVQ